MASAKPKQNPRSTAKQGRYGYPPQPASEPEVVEPMWLVKAIALTVVAALVCGYLALCLLFYQGQWQLVLHPSSRVSTVPGIDGAVAETIRFGTDESATPQRTGIYLPAANSGRYRAWTVLYLPAGDGQLSDDYASLTLLHDLGLNVFAFDYRGYGMSLRDNPGQPHPNQQRMTEDVASAWQYLTVSRGLRGAQIIPFGKGVGAALAAGLATGHSSVPLLLVDQPWPDVTDAVRRDPRTSALPFRALFHERFEITGALASLRTPKFLVLRQGAAEPDVEDGSARHELAQSAADPKFILSLDPAASAMAQSDMLSAALGRFLDQYLHL